MRRAERYAKAARCLDLVLEYFGPNGKRWCQGQGDGRKRCLVAAVCHVQLKHGFHNQLTFDLLDAAIPAPTIVELNDDRRTSFAEVRAVILEAKANALAEVRKLKLARETQREMQRPKLAA